MDQCNVYFRVFPLDAFAKANNIEVGLWLAEHLTKFFRLLRAFGATGDYLLVVSPTLGSEPFGLLWFIFDILPLMLLVHIRQPNEKNNLDAELETLQGRTDAYLNISNLQLSKFTLTLLKQVRFRGQDL